LLVSKDEYDKMENFMLGPSDKQPVVKNVGKTPSAFNEDLKSHKKQINAWSNKPYWVRDNAKYVVTLKK